MNRNIILAPSLLAADFSNLREILSLCEAGGAEYLHLDVMDGFFVPNISFGVPVIKSLRACTGMVFDVHLMVSWPERYIKQFADAGADIITIHAEATQQCAETLASIRGAGKKAGIAIKPATPVDAIKDLLPLCDLALVMTVEPGFGGQSFMGDMLPKASALRGMRSELGLDFLIEADGGISAANAAECVNAGVDVLVAGSSVLGKPDVKLAAEALITAAKRA